MVFDVAYARGLYVSLSDGWTYLNAHDRAQIPERVSSAVSSAFRSSGLLMDQAPLTGTHGRQPEVGETVGLQHVASARVAVADLVGATPDRVVLGPSKEVLLRNLAEAMRPRLRRSTQTVLTRVDDVLVTSPFSTTDSAVVWAEPDLGTGELPSWQFNKLVDGSTRLVVIPAAHPYLGTVTDVAAISEIVQEKSRAWLLVDASAYAPYRSIDMDAWGADIVVVEFSPMGGPAMAALVFRDTTMFPLLAAVNPLADPASALKLELGRNSAGLAGGVTAIVEHYSILDERLGGTRATRLRRSFAGLERHGRELTRHLINSLQGLPKVHILGVSGEAAGSGAAKLDRIPRLSFLVTGVPAATVHRRLLTNGLVTTLSPCNPLLEAMGVFDGGGAITISLSPFNTLGDIDQLTRVLASLA
ncbi:aminotransferase class V-fold PLP-dependent enzyme [Corynebacterium epidermidicanis]|uniref:Selenocysteine lyase n=1 Tax=Corynebacterium epidermidicanis TaxID=1050174 RepID=A0A0G3GTB7_9CORY|nr:aminotransferase class V-fold PLP-dependent enzyme [Corynebacterium epidermidicanis]AKK02102.1 selenocysteine lyase [Corynebacterium epidermidicanis]